MLWIDQQLLLWNLLLNDLVREPLSRYLQVELADVPSLRDTGWKCMNHRNFLSRFSFEELVGRLFFIISGKTACVHGGTRRVTGMADDREGMMYAV